jgi:hypothetical protein
MALRMDKRQVFTITNPPGPNVARRDEVGEEKIPASRPSPLRAKHENSV